MYDFPVFNSFEEHSYDNYVEYFLNPRKIEHL